MSTRFQAFLLRNTTSLQYLVNQRLATRGGAIGNIFKALEMGPRQYGHHSLLKSLRVVNYFYMMIYQHFGMMRPVFSRFIGNQQGPLNYSGIFVWALMSMFVIARFRFIRSRDVLNFNAQDNPEFWFARYNMMFPPSFLHNRLSAHYIEINHIFAIEMMKKYQLARKEILDEREKCSDVEKRTRYISNTNYVHEPLGPDSYKMMQAKMEGIF